MFSKNERPINARSRRRAPSISLSLILLLGAGAAGCGDNAAEALPTEDTPAFGEHPNDREATPKASALLFKDPSTSGPRLDVYDANGRAAVAVSGPIGSEAILSAFDGSESLIGLYRAIHGSSVAIPTELTALDGRFAAEFAAMRARADTLGSVPEATLDKSLSSFNSTVCKRFVQGSAEYRPFECKWNANTRYIALNTGSIEGGDRTYGWNHNAGWAWMGWVVGGTWSPAGTYVPPWSWTWFTIWDEGPYGVHLGAISSSEHPGPIVSGERGLTWHSVRYIVQ
jgi:hypothetical protein